METDRIKERARKTMNGTREQVRDLANTGREQVADQMGAVARALHGAGERLRSEDNAQASYYTNLVGEKAERIASYLRDRDALDIVDEVEDFARTSPLVFLGGCAVVGLLVGRFLKASPDEEPSLPAGIESTYPTADWAPGYRVSGTPEPELASPVVTAPIISTPRRGDGSEGG